MSTIQRTWVWRFNGPPEAVWPFLADTVRFNEAAGLDKHDIEEIPQPDGSVRYFGHFKKGPFTIRWEERPVEWTTGRRFLHCRDFLTGPFRSLCAELVLHAENGGCRADYTVDIVPRRGFGWLLRSINVMSSIGRTFTGVVGSIQAHLDGAKETAFDAALPKDTDESSARIETLAQRIEQTPHGHGLAPRLGEHIRTAQETDLFRIRPLALARHWDVDQRNLVECCLESVRAGMMFLRWDLLCPNCQGAKETASTLDALPDGAHCPTCNIDYGRDFSRNVELTFHPAPTVRDIVDGEYCLFAPMTTPHIKVQQTLSPGETRAVEVDLPFAPYRLRTLHRGGEASIEWTKGGFPEVLAEAGEIRTGDPADPGTVVLSNRTSEKLTLVIEAQEWARDALTADRVTTMQAFRDLFSDQVLRPGDEVAVRNIALMFTDLKGSTAMYGRIGDASAYGLVREHFAVLTTAVRDHNGTIVKTIGDAVMAAFVDPRDAIEGALAVQEAVARLEPASDDSRLVLKVGVHTGPCIAVTLNDRLDYFGSTVNMAARLQGESEGGDIVLSRAIARDGDAATLLTNCEVTTEEAQFKGFDAPVEFLRARPLATRPGLAVNA